MSFLFPQRLCCHACGRMLTAEEGLLCTACQHVLDACLLKRKEEEVIFKGEQLLSAAAYSYTGMAASLIQSLKYQADQAVACTLALGMAKRFSLMESLRAADACVFVPSHPEQAARRGYVQAQVLCDAFTAITGVPQMPHTLRRVRQARSQVGMNREERKKQIVGAFAAHEYGIDAVTDRCILLIDDVLTTGATACECTKVLYAAGARRVLVLTACRA